MSNKISFLKALVVPALVAASMVGLSATPSMAGPCLTAPAATVGNPIFGANVGTFIGLGIDPNVTCIENGLWTDPSGFALGSYVKNGSGGFGYGYDPTVLGAYNGAGSASGNANGRDFYWIQNTAADAFGGFLGTNHGSAPSNGIVWDLGGQANQVAVFVFVDHGPVPLEVLENTAWLSNNPNAPDAGWTQASLVHVYGDGWSPDPNVADGFVAVYQLPSAATFRYVSVTWGGPGAIQQDGDNEIDAVGGLNFQGGGLNNTVPEPGTLSLLAVAVGGLGALRRRKKAKA
jgi:hypothetical protein